MVPPSLRSVYLAMAERLTTTAWVDTADLLEGPNGADAHSMYRRVLAGLTAVRSAYLGTGCLTNEGRAYLGLPAVPVIDGAWPSGGRRGRG